MVSTDYWICECLKPLKWHCPQVLIALTLTKAIDLGLLFNF